MRSTHTGCGLAGADAVGSGKPLFVCWPASTLLQCPESAVSGTCSFRSLLDAASTCMRTSGCRSVVVFPNGAPEGNATCGKGGVAEVRHAF